uniref:Ovule protein n=1 Tax=Taenia asiatica TaxID=60517 RepID=A0A0R3WHE6_TAEAS
LRFELSPSSLSGWDGIRANCQIFCLPRCSMNWATMWIESIGRSPLSINLICKKVYPNSTHALLNSSRTFLSTIQPKVGGNRLLFVFINCLV